MTEPVAIYLSSTTSALLRDEKGIYMLAADDLIDRLTEADVPLSYTKGSLRHEKLKTVPVWEHLAIEEIDDREYRCGIWRYMIRTSPAVAMPVTQDMARLYLIRPNVVAYMPLAKVRRRPETLLVEEIDQHAIERAYDELPSLQHELMPPDLAYRRLCGHLDHVGVPPVIHEM